MTTWLLDQLNSVPGVEAQVRGQCVRARWTIGRVAYEFEYELSPGEAEAGRFAFIERAARKIHDERAKRFPSA